MPATNALGRWKERKRGREREGRRWRLAETSVVATAAAALGGLLRPSCPHKRQLREREREGGEKEKEGGEGGGEAATGWWKRSPAVQWPFGGPRGCVSAIWRLQVASPPPSSPFVSFPPPLSLYLSLSKLPLAEARGLGNLLGATIGLLPPPSLFLSFPPRFSCFRVGSGRYGPVQGVLTCSVGRHGSSSELAILDMEH